MRIVVCVKQLCQVYARTGMDPETQYLRPEDKVYRVNPYDEAALYAAAEVKRALGQAEVRLLTLGPLKAERELRRCAALVGADGLFQIVSVDDPDPWAKSVLLARAIKEMGADLVLCGKESLDARHGQVGGFLAHHLGLPFISSIKRLDISREGTTARVERSGGRGLLEIWESPVPAVFSVDMGSREILLPTYEEKKRAEALAIQALRCDAGVVSKIRRVGIRPPRPRPKRIPAPESRLPAFERIRQLLSGSRIEKKGLILSGSAESQVEGLISFLKGHAFLKPTPPEEG